MSGKIVPATWAKPDYKVAAFWRDSKGRIHYRGLYKLRSRTDQDDPDNWEWLSSQLESEFPMIVTEKPFPGRLIYDYLPGNVVIGRHPKSNEIVLILANGG